jgi:hypothetical protein
LSSTSVRHRQRSLALAIAGAIWASNLSTRAIAQSLAITSPSDGAVVSPGQTLTVSVSSPSNSTFSKVVVLGEGELGFTPVATSSVPAQFSVRVPTQIACRHYLLGAVGVTTSGLEVSTSITIDVERLDMPYAITTQMRQIIFEAEGETSAIDLFARFQDGTVLPVQESSSVTYQSSDPGVATVDANGGVTAVANGRADITATYGAPAAGVTARIAVSVPASLLALSPNVLAFGDQAVGTTSSQQTGVTNRSSGALSITSVTATGDYTQANTCLASSPLLPEASCTITVTFGPTLPGLRTGAIDIATSFHLVPIRVNLMGTGTGR